MHKSLVTPKGFNYLGLAIVLLVTSLFTEIFFSLAIIYVICLFMVFYYEYRTLYNHNSIRLSSGVIKNETVDSPFELNLIVDIYSQNYYEVEINFDDLEIPCQVIDCQLESVSRMNKAHFQCLYKVTLCFNRIGSYKFSPLQLVSQSSHGIWARQIEACEFDRSLHIWPKKEKVNDEELRKIFRQQAFMSQRTAPARLQTSRDIFYSMREFQYGDSIRSIDAKKSARFSKPITRLYEETKQNNIFLFLDLGRNMEGNIQGSYTLNYYFYVMVSLAQTAMELGDKVTLCGISDKVEFLYPNFSGLESLQTIMAEAHKIQSHHKETDYHLINNVLETYHVKRSLVILLSDFSRPSVQKSITEIVRHLGIKHIPLLLSLLDDQYDIEKNLSHNVTEMDDYKKLVYSMAINERMKLFSSVLSTSGAFHFNVNCSKWMDFAPKAFRFVRESFVN